jgi:Mce-associated membrane protein
VSEAPTWYDVLDVPRDASAEEVRTAWKSQIADLEPGDRRFDALNRAAKVLLDPGARAAYDAAHPASPPVEEGAPASPPVEEGALAPVTRPAGPGLATRLRRSSTSESQPEERAGVPAWLLAGLAIVAAGLVAATLWMWLAGDGGSGEESAARDAQVAAERAAVPVLSYDYEHLADDQKAAQALMTGNYREEYDKLFTVLEENAPETRTKVTASVIASGIVRATDDRVQVLVFVDRPTTNKLSAEPVVYKDQVTLSMQLVDGEWLVDDLTTSPVQG